MAVLKDIVDAAEQVLKPVESIRYAFLFGSVLGQLLPQSDIDILIGGSVDFSERMRLVAELSLKLKRSVDLVLVGESRSGLVVKAMSKGMLIFAKDREILKSDYLVNWRRFDDAAGMRKIKVTRIKQQYGYGR